MGAESMSREQAWYHYETLRNAAYAQTMSEYSAQFGGRLLLTHLNAGSVKEANTWGTGLSWMGLLNCANSKRPRNFDVAVCELSSDGTSAQIYGAAHGRVSKAERGHVRVDILSRAPDPNPFAGYVTEIVLRCAQNYANFTNKSRVLFTEPREERFEHFMRIFDGNYRKSDANFPYDYFYAFV